MNLDSLPQRLGNNRTPRRQPCDLIVIHTNEGPEGPTTAEGLAGFLAHAPDNYNVIVDENGAIRTAGDNEVVWGAGGVNSRAWHICITGRASFPVTVWSDPSESKAVAIVADLARQAAAKFGIPFSRVTDSRPPHRGVCGHVDVSRYYPASQGHTDPGPNFPWDRIFNLPAPAPKPKPKRGKRMNLVQVQGGSAIAITDGMHKRILTSAHDFGVQQWLIGVQGGNPNVTFVPQETWDQLVTLNVPAHA